MPTVQQSAAAKVISCPMKLAARRAQDCAYSSTNPESAASITSSPYDKSYRRCRRCAGAATRRSTGSPVACAARLRHATAMRAVILLLAACGAKPPPQTWLERDVHESHGAHATPSAIDPAKIDELDDAAVRAALEGAGDRAPAT